MRKSTILALSLSAATLGLVQCSKDAGGGAASDLYPAVRAAFGTKIDLDNLANYAGQAVPNYVRKDNTGGNVITDKKATLGRVLF